MSTQKWTKTCEAHTFGGFHSSAVVARIINEVKAQNYRHVRNLERKVGRIYTDLTIRLAFIRTCEDKTLRKALLIEAMQKYQPLAQAVNPKDLGTHLANVVVAACRGVLRL